MSCLFLSDLVYSHFSGEELSKDRASLASSNSESSVDEDEDIYADMLGDDGGFEREEEEGQEGAEPGEPSLAREYILNPTHLQDIVGAQKVQGFVVWVWV